MKQIDVRRAVENAPVGRYHCYLAFLIALIVFFEGYGTFSSAYVIHYVMEPWRLRPSEAGLLVSSAMVGFAIGSLTEGSLSDRFGRRIMLLGALWVASVFSFCTAAFANSFLSFCGWRFLTGLGLGVLLPLGITYMNEYAPRRLKSTFSTWGWGLGFSAGGVAASTVGIFLTPRLGWQSLYYVASFSAVLAVVCHLSLPESLQFLALRGKTGGIASLLSRLDPSHQVFYQAPGVQFTFPEPKDRLASASLLLSLRYRRTTLSVWAAAFFLLFAIYGLTGWVPTAMMARGESFAASFSYGALILAMNFIGTLACGYFADRHGEHPAALIVWWIGGALAVAIVAVINNHTFNFLCMSMAGFFVLGGQGTLNNLTATWYETEVRGTAVGMMLGVGRLGGILGPYLVGLLQQILPGSLGLFPAIAAAVLLGAVSIAFAVPRPSNELVQEVNT